jgi:hypothetical protein
LGRQLAVWVRHVGDDTGTGLGPAPRSIPLQAMPAVAK